MPQVELHFPVVGSSLSSDHGYELYAALSRVAPELHGEQSKIRIAPIRGIYAGRGLLQIDSRFSRLRLRLAPDDMRVVLRLAGKALMLGTHKVRLGVPQVRALIPAPNLIARMVVIKSSSPRTDAADKKSRDRAATLRYLDAVTFREGVRSELARREIHGEAELPAHETGPRAGEPWRHMLRVHGKAIVGFSVIVQGLTAEESIRLQEEGLGGRGKMGCGFFVPLRQGNQ